MDTNTQVFRDKRTTARTHFTGIAGINLQECPTSICRFVGHELCKLRPRNIGYALVEFIAKDLGVICHHFSDGKLFKDDDAKFISQSTRYLMGKVSPFVGDTGIDPTDNHALLASLRRTLGVLLHATLGFSQGVLFSFEKAGVRNLLAGTERREGLQPNIYAYPLRFFW